MNTYSINYNMPEYWNIFHLLNDNYYATRDICDILSKGRYCIDCPFDLKDICGIDTECDSYTAFIKTALPGFKITNPEYFV